MSWRWVAVPEDDVPRPEPGPSLPWDRVVLSVVVPVYNERETVEAVLRRVREIPVRTEVVVVDDGSTDGTVEVLGALEEEGVVDVLVLLEENLGKGAALRTGFRRAGGDIVVVQDADLEYDPHELPWLMKPILEGRADAVFGSRFLGGPHRVHLFWHWVGNRVLTLLSDALTDLNLTDMETCYKMVRRDLLERLPLRAERFGIEPELTARLAQARARVYEMPASYHGRSYEEGKKIRWTDGLAAFWHIFRSNFLPPRARPWDRPERAPWEERGPPAGAEGEREPNGGGHTSEGPGPGDRQRGSQDDPGDSGAPEDAPRASSDGSRAPGVSRPSG